MANSKNSPLDLNDANTQPANDKANEDPIHTCKLTYKRFACASPSQFYKFQECEDHAFTPNLDYYQRSGINELITELNAIFGSFPANTSHHLAGIMTVSNMTSSTINFGKFCSLVDLHSGLYWPLCGFIFC